MKNWMILSGLAALAWACTGSAVGTTPAPRVTGHWSFTAYTDSGDSSVGTLSIFPRASATVGVLELPGADSVNVKIHWKGAYLWFSAPRHAAPDADGRGTGRFFTVIATPRADGSLQGTWSLEGGPRGDWHGRPISGPAHP